MDWSIEDAAHLMRRAGFGGHPSEITALHALGREAAISQYLDPDTDPTPDMTAPTGFDLDRPAGAAAWYVYRLVHSNHPLEQKLTYFWHGHFTSSILETPPRLMTGQIETWQRHAMGRFVDFLKVMYKDPAMLIYLDNATNVSGAPNENFARELFELFTLGPGHYTETDIQEAARALTGWTVLRRAPDTGVFIPRRHDGGQKSILGHSGAWDGDDLMEIVAAHPATAPWICGALYRFFVHPTPPAAEIDALTATWHASDGQLKAVLAHLFHLDAFWHPDNRFTLVKSPLEYVIGLLAQLELPLVELEYIGRQLRAMGQIPLAPPMVAGYPVDLQWAGSSNLLARYNFVHQVLSSVWGRQAVDALLSDLEITTSARLVDDMLQRMGPLPVSDATKTVLNAYLTANAPEPWDRQIRLKTAGLIHLISTLPEYQLN